MLNAIFRDIAIGIRGHANQLQRAKSIGEEAGALQTETDGLTKRLEALNGALEEECRVLKARCEKLEQEKKDLSSELEGCKRALGAS